MVTRNPSRQTGTEKACSGEKKFTFAKPICRIIYGTVTGENYPKAESLLSRMQRLVSGRAEDAVDRLEAANPTVVMRETIREMDRVSERMRQQHAKLAARRVQAERLQKTFDTQIEELNAKARYALDEERDDLARGALARVIDLEKQRDLHVRVATEAVAEGNKLEEAMAELTAERTEMKKVLDATEAAAATNRYLDVAPGYSDEALAARLDRARSSFERVNGFTMAPSVETIDAVAEIDQLRSAADLDARLAALKDGNKGSKKK